MDDIRMDPLIWSKGRVIVSHFHFIPQNDPFFTKKQHVNISPHVSVQRQNMRNADDVATSQKPVNSSPKPSTRDRTRIFQRKRGG